MVAAEEIAAAEDEVTIGLVAEIEDVVMMDQEEKDEVVATETEEASEEMAAILGLQDDRKEAQTEVMQEIENVTKPFLETLDQDDLEEANSL